MQRVFTCRYSPFAALAVLVGATSIYGQIPSTGMSQSIPGSSQMGTSGNQNNAGGFQNPDDKLTAVAPPFDVEDVLRMHRVGLQDEVIDNALRTRYHPLVLTDAERSVLKGAGISDRVIVAIEDPYGIGIQNVRSNMAAANSEAPPVAQTEKQAREADPKTPKLTRRSESNSVGSGSGDVYVGQSHPDSLTDIGNDGGKSSANAGAPASSMASLDLRNTPVTHVPPEPTTKIVSQPIGPGVYMRHGSEWERVGGEPIYWNHHGDRNIEGSILRPESSSQTYPGGTDFLVITAAGTSAIQYQFVRLHANDVRRTFVPAPAGGVYTAGGGVDLIRFDPQQLGPSSWLISLHDVAAGEYGLLPPVTSQIHSTTNQSTTLFTFRIK
jgi:hypothetical protein